MVFGNVTLDPPVARPELVEMWRNNLRKSMQRFPVAALKPITLNFEWTGGGLPIESLADPVTMLSVPTACDPIKLTVPCPARIVWARLCAGDALGQPVAVSATIDLRLTQFETFGVSTPLYGVGAIPRIQEDSVADMPLDDWQTNLITGDWIIGRLATFDGLATWIALDLLLRPIDVQLGVSGVVDSGGDTIVDNDGNVIVLRN